MKVLLRGLLLASLVARGVAAQSVIVYDDAAQNGFLDYSYGGGTVLQSAAQVRSGSYAIAFTGNAYNAVALANPTDTFTTAAYPTLRLWVHGGASGGQQLRVNLENDGAGVASAEIDTFISGGAIAANSWREVVISFASAPLAYSGPFDRIDFQSDVGGTQPVLYLDDISLEGQPAQPATELQIDHDVTVGSMVSDRFTWRDRANEPRVAVLAHNNGQTGPGGTRGGELREFRYQAGGATRIVGAASTGAAGFGYVVAHPNDTTMTCSGLGDSSSLGHFTPGSFTRVFEGRHHAIFRFTQNYPRYCRTGAQAPQATIQLPVTIDWVFSTGRDHPLWAVTWDMSGLAVNTLDDDARGPYGELLFDGAATAATHSAIAGVGWGDRYKFSSTTNPVTMNSAWTWNVANSIPYVKLWTTAVDATMGTVQTQPIAQQDAGGYWGTGRWNTMSANGNACGATTMPCNYNWPYQSINYSLVGTNATNNTRLAWGTNFGFLGQSQYRIHGSAYYGGPLPDTWASGWPRKSYSLFVVLGQHSEGPVEAQVTQIETLQSVTLSATVGSVPASGSGGAGRADLVTYTPAGYDHVYAALAFVASDNQLDANVAVGAGTLVNPLFIIRNFTADAPTVQLGGVPLVADTDYFASLRPDANELWITLNRSLTGAVNHLEIVTAGGGGAPAAPTNLAATASSSTQVGLTWNASAGASSYEVDRRAPGGGFVQIGTPATNAFSDETAAAGTAYLYRVRAVNANGASPDSAVDLATTVIFTDPVLSGVPVKAAHLAQLRSAIDAVRALASLGPGSFTDAASSGLTIKALHLTQARSSLDEARALLALSTGGWVDPSPAGLPVSAAQWDQLRQRTR